MIKVTRMAAGWWKLEPLSGPHYISVISTVDYDCDNSWVAGWHLKFRDKLTGATVKVGHCYQTRAAAISAAKFLLGETD
jgi:hypothetical protein